MLTEVDSQTLGLEWHEHGKTYDVHVKSLEQKMWCPLNAYKKSEQDVQFYLKM